jgi:hypothetical protein
MIVNALIIVLVLILQRPGTAPDATIHVPMDSLVACQEEVKAWLELGLSERQHAAGFVGKGGACYTNQPEGQI